jgi:oligosaccharyltransferase complex subunit alpha (ribophorin I)
MHLSSALGCLLASLLPLLAAASFENTAIVRTVELGGALVHVTTTYAVRATEPGAAVYTIALSERDAARTSWLEARIKGQKNKLELENVLSKPDGCVCRFPPLTMLCLGGG